jgi:single-strand DNA-binding protein
MNGTLNVMLIGFLGDDIKMYFDGGNCIEDFSWLPMKLYIKTTNEKITSTEWHNLVRNKAAEFVKISRG